MNHLFNKHMRIRLGWAYAPVSARATKLSLLVTIASVLALGVLGGMPAVVAAAPPTAVLGTATSFSVLGGSTVTNTGATTLQGDLGVYPDGGGAPTGTASIVFSGGGSVHAGDGVAHTAQTDATAAYNTLAGPPPACTITYPPGDYLASIMGSRRRTFVSVNEACGIVRVRRCRAGVGTGEVWHA